MAVIGTMGGNKHLVKECFDVFCEIHGDMLKQIQKNLKTKNFSRVVTLLTGFRDGVKNLSCKPLMDAAFSLERAVAAQNHPAMEKGFIVLTQACKRLREFMETYSVKNLFLKFLIVDADFDSRKKFQKILSHYGECDVAFNGLEALNAFARAHHEDDPYHLIFLDMEMQDLEGPQGMKKIRQWEKSRAIPLSQGVKIILLSTEFPPEAITCLLEPGYETCMEKPVTRERLAQAFQQIHYI